MSARPNKQMVIRAMIVMTSLVLCLSIISGVALVKIMIVDGEEYQSKASAQQLYDNLVAAPRGDIYDSDMNLLATSSTAWTVYITPNEIRKIEDETEALAVKNAIADGLSEVLGLEREDVLEKTEQQIYYVIVKKKIDKEAADRVREFITENKDLKMSKYIGIDQTTKRYYPGDSLASTVIGFVGDDNQGLAGLESYYDNDLTGVAGRVVAAKNAKGTDMSLTYQKVEEAVQGSSLVTTLKSYVQYSCEKHLDLAVEEDKVLERGAAIVMNVNTGEILGMAVSGDFNCNDPFMIEASQQAVVDAEQDDEKKQELKSDYLNRQWRNKAVSDTYEPGSVFKIFTSAVALEESLITENNSFSCNYVYTVAGNPYHCHKRSGHGIQSLSQAISNSCNPAFIQIGQLIGVSTFQKYFKAFGLTEKTGIDLPGEALPYYHLEKNMGATELASSSFGQTFNITPLHMITLAAAAVNGGYLVTPHLVEKMVDADGKVIKTMSSGYKRQVISEDTSATMRRLLEYVVDNGAKTGAVAGYRVGGKTGTSEKVSKMLELNVDGLYIGSYVGIAPMENPEIAVFVMLDEPTSGRYYGSAISAPVGAKIMADILPYLGYEPQYSAEELENLSVAVPDVVNQPLDAAKERITALNLAYKVVGSGNAVIKQLPEAGGTVHKNGTVILYTDESESGTVAVPQFVGLTAAEANSVAAAAGVNIEFSGNTSAPELKAHNQSVAAGTPVPEGQVITVYFREEASADMSGDE